jgi:hypothetical protein
VAWLGGARWWDGKCPAWGRTGDSCSASEGGVRDGMGWGFTGGGLVEGWAWLMEVEGRLLVHVCDAGMRKCTAICERSRYCVCTVVSICRYLFVCPTSSHLTTLHLTSPLHLSTALIDPSTSASGEVETRDRTPPISLLHKYRHDPAAHHGTRPNMFLPTPRPRFTRRLNRSIKPGETPNATPRHASTNTLSLRREPNPTSD